MSFNIIDTVKGQISDQLIGQIGGLLGESPDKARGAVDSALPTLLAGIGESAQDPNGADTLFNLVQRQDDNVVDRVGAMIGSNQSSELIESGTRGLGSLLGSNGVTSMINGLSGHTGLGKGSAGSLLGMMTPMIFGQLKRKVGADGLNANGLASMLKSQGSNISAAMPQGMLRSLESAGFGDARTHATTTTTNTSTSAGYAGAKVAAGAAAATAAAGAAAGTVSRTASTAGSNTATAVRNTAGSATGTVSRGASNAATAARDTAGTAGRTVSNTAGNAVDATRNAASTAGARTSAAASSAAGATRDAAGTVGRATERGVDAAGNRVGGAVDSSRTAANNTTRAATGTSRTDTHTTSTRTRVDTGTTSYEEPRKSGGFWKWLIPLALLVAGWFGFKALGTKDADVTEATTGAVESTTETETATGAATGAAAGADIEGQFGDFFGSTADTLNGISDEASATAALPQLEAAQESLGGLTSMLSGADDAAKTAAAGAVENGMGTLGPIVEKLQGNEGIWGILSPVLGPIMDTLKGIGG